MKKRILSSLILVVFVCSFLSFDLLKVKDSFADALALPSPSTMLELSKNKDLLSLKGINVNPENLFDVSFYFDGKSKDMEKDAQLLIEYFLTALSFDGNDLWVNLSPYEKDRILNEKLASTQLGKVLLKQDYILKQLSSSLTNPQTNLGKKYWKELDNSFNKIWIAPQVAEVAQDGNLALIKESSLKVLTEADYLAMQKNSVLNNDKKNVLKNKILPLIEKDVNSGANFAELRQVYSALILGFWFKQKYFHTLYSHYIDSAKVKGVDTSDPELKQKVFNMYAESFNKGVYNKIIKAKNENGILEKKNYLSGGIQANPKVSTTELIAQDFKNLESSSALGFLKPVLKQVPVAKTILLAAMIAFTPIFGQTVNVYSQTQAETSLRQTRQSQQIDNLMSVASDESQTESARVDALESIHAEFVDNPDPSYFQELVDIIEADSTYTIREKALAAVHVIYTHEVNRYLYNYTREFYDQGVDNLSEVDLKVMQTASLYLGFNSRLLYDNDLWYDTDGIGDLLLHLINPDDNEDYKTRWKAWAGAGQTFTNSDNNYINQLQIYYDAEPNSMVKTDAGYSLDYINERPAKHLYKDFIFLHENLVASYDINIVHDTIVRVARDEYSEYTNTARSRTFEIIRDGNFHGHMIGDSATLDETTYNAIKDLFSGSRSSDNSDLVAKWREAVDALEERLEKVSTVTHQNNVLAPNGVYGTVRGAAHNLQLRGTVNEESMIRVYSLNGRLLHEQRVNAGFQMVNLDLSLLGQQMIIVNVTSLRRISRRDEEEDDLERVDVEIHPDYQNEDGTLDVGKIETDLASGKFYRKQPKLLVEAAEDYAYAADSSTTSSSALEVDVEVHQDYKNIDGSVNLDRIKADMRSGAFYRKFPKLKKQAAEDFAYVGQNDSSSSAVGGIDMNLSVSSSALKEELYSTMSPEQIREHKAQSELLAGFTFELKMQKGKLRINDILAQKK